MTDHARQTLANSLNLSTMDDPWSAYTPPPGDRERLWGKNRTFLGDVWFRFCRRMSALFGLVLISCKTGLSTSKIKSFSSYYSSLSFPIACKSTPIFLKYSVNREYFNRIFL